VAVNNLDCRACQGVGVFRKSKDRGKGAIVLMGLKICNRFAGRILKIVKDIICRGQCFRPIGTSTGGTVETVNAAAARDDKRTGMFIAVEGAVQCCARLNIRKSRHPAVGQANFLVWLEKQSRAAWHPSRPISGILGRLRLRWVLPLGNQFI
jgi:hypothetical protein